MDDKKKLLKNIFSFFFSSVRFLTRNEFFCFLIILYIIIVIVGTVEQRNFGLEYAQEIYFNSNFTFLFKKIPFLGGKLILFCVFLILLFRLLIDKWKKKKIGTILLHSGVLFLLLGAFVSNKYCIEGKIIIKENEYNNFFLRSDLYELKIVDRKHETRTVIPVYINKHVNHSININNVTISISNFNNNCELINRKIFLTKNEMDGIGRFFLINRFPSFVEQEENRVNIFIKIHENNNIKNIYLLEDNYKVIDYDYNDINISLEKKKEHLPFSLFLSKFEKIVYQGTNKAKNYVSNLIIENDDGIIWKNRLEMNKPLRINDYTFYQTSYLDNSLERATILTVVKNYWSFYPYFSIFLIFLGFLMHLIISFNKILRIKE